MEGVIGLGVLLYDSAGHLTCLVAWRQRGSSRTWSRAMRQDAWVGAYDAAGHLTCLVAWKQRGS